MIILKGELISCTKKTTKKDGTEYQVLSILCLSPSDAQAEVYQVYDFQSNIKIKPDMLRKDIELKVTVWANVYRGQAQIQFGVV